MTKQQFVLSARLEDLQTQLDETWSRFEWVLAVDGETHWAEGLLDQAARLEEQISEVQARLASL
jgi:hypothetical protein